MMPLRAWLAAAYVRVACLMPKHHRHGQTHDR